MLWNVLMGAFGDKGLFDMVFMNWFNALYQLQQEHSSWESTQEEYIRIDNHLKYQTQVCKVSQFSL